VAQRLRVACYRGRVKAWLKRIVVLVVLLGAALAAAVFWMTSMPGESHSGALPELTDAQSDAAKRIRKTLHRLAEEIGPRNVEHPKSLEKAAKFIDRSWKRQGYAPTQEWVQVGDAVVYNLVAELPGGSAAKEVIVVGAHYDTAGSTPGANDNGSGVAALLELSKRFSGQSFPRTVRFVAFVNEEPPHFQTAQMGSFVHAEQARESGDQIMGMLSLETLGYYTNAAGSQKYPPLVDSLYPASGNFVGFVSNLGSAGFVRDCVGIFREHADFPSEGIAAPDVIEGIGWSDHWSFYEQGYPALMVTDTAPFRYPHYHEDSDRIDEVDAEAIARIVDGLAAVVSELAGEPLP
jgi:hypothetical protein